jgi:hypothetical protein
VTEIGGTRLSNVRANGAKRVQDVKVVKVPNRRAGPGGFTIVATPRAKVGDSGVIDGVRYTVRSERQLRDLIRQKRWRDVERTCTSRIMNMRGMFKGTNFNGNIGHWDTSHVTTMAEMFRNATFFNQPLNGWDTKMVYSMWMMFREAVRFNQPICKWNTSGVVDMGGMFWRASKFNQSINEWDTSRVRSMMSMFRDTMRFNQRIGTWDTASVEDMSYMFYDAMSFNMPISRWNTSGVEGMEMMFYAARKFNQPIGRWNVSNVRYMRDMFKYAGKFNKPIGRWAPSLRQDIDIDDDTRARIGDPETTRFRNRRYRLHSSVNGQDMIMLNKIPLRDAMVIASDTATRNGVIRHVFHKASINGMIKSGRTLRHPMTREPFSKHHIVPLKNVLHANDAKLYNQLANGKTIGNLRNT